MIAYNGLETCFCFTRYTVKMYTVELIKDFYAPYNSNFLFGITLWVWYLHCHGVSIGQ